MRYLLIILKVIFIFLSIIFGLALILSIVDIYYNLDNFDAQPHLIWTFAICLPIFIILAYAFDALLKNRGDYGDY